MQWRMLHYTVKGEWAVLCVALVVYSADPLVPVDTLIEGATCPLKLITHSHTAGTACGRNLGLIVLPEDTRTDGAAQPGIRPPEL